MGYRMVYRYLAKQLRAHGIYGNNLAGARDKWGKPCGVRVIWGKPCGVRDIWRKPCGVRDIWGSLAVYGIYGESLSVVRDIWGYLAVAWDI